jgi:hypothetical protein
MENKDFKTVATYNELMMARITAAMLNDHGIPASVFGYDSSYPSLGFARSIEVKVNADDYDEAMSLIAAAESAE